MTRIDPRVVIVGEAPGRRDSGTLPLFGTGPQYAGWRLREMAGLTRAEWRDVRRVNLFASLPERWDRREARHVVLAWSHALLRRHRVVCLGRRVAAAFMVADLAPCTWRRWAEHSMAGPMLVATVPHPSGRNLYYNDPTNRAMVGRFLRRTLTGDYP